MSLWYRIQMMVWTQWAMSESLSLWDSGLTSLSWSLASCPCWVPPPPFLPPLLTGAGVGPPFCRTMPPFSTAGLSWLSWVSLNSLMARSLVLSHVLKIFSNHSFMTSLSDLFILSTNTFEVPTWKEDCFIDCDWQNSLVNSNLELYCNMFGVSGNWNQQKKIFLVQNFRKAHFYLVVAILTNVMMALRPGVLWKYLRWCGRWWKAGQQLVRRGCCRGVDRGAGARARARAKPLLAAKPIALSCER